MNGKWGLNSWRVQSVDLTEMARNGKLDPIIGRDEGTREVALRPRPTTLMFSWQKFVVLFKVCVDIVHHERSFIPDVKYSLGGRSLIQW